MGLILSGVGSGPAGISSAWDAFFHDWVKPVVNFGTPLLIVFAVLLTLTRVLTGALVTKDSPGIRSAKASAQLPVSVMYWFGIICLLYSAIEATVIFPLARDVVSGKPKASASPAPWTAELSVVMVAVAGVVVLVLYCIVGRPLRRTVYAPGLTKQERKELGLESYARIGWTIAIAAGMALGAAVLSAGVIGLWWRFRWLDDRITPGAYAPLLAALGIVIVGRARGIGMEFVIRGHNKSGNDDGGLGTSMGARLSALASHGPAGIQVTEQTDVSTLPQGTLGTTDASTVPQQALSLIPGGILAKLARLFMSLFTPAPPWRVDVTEQSDGIAVSIVRNGAAADRVVIQPSTLWLPDRSANNAGTAYSADDTSTAADGSSGRSDPDWTMELRTAAAAFVLLTLSKRYYHLRAGLSGAHDWRSVAMQVIATDPACHLSADDKRALLANAVAEDDGNMAAQLALINASYRPTADQRENRLFVEKLYGLLEKVPNDDGMWPLRLRLRFNLLACLLNEAASFERRYDRPLPQSKDVPEIRDVLCRAAKQAGHLVVFWQNRENQKALPDLWDDMDVAVTTAAIAVRVEWERRFDDPMEVTWKEDLGDHKRAKVTLLARYQKVCLLVGYAALSAGQQQLDRYTEALNELEMVTAVEYFRTRARADPSLAELHDIDTMTKLLLSPTAGVSGEPNAADVAAMRAAEYVGRFKRLIGDPCPADFLALAPFARHRAVIEERGINSAADLGREAAATLVSELGITADIADRWLEVARLYTWLRQVPPASRPANDAADPDTITTALVFLLMEANLDSVPDLGRELQQDAGNGLGQFRARLLDYAQPWAVVVPGEYDIGCWQQKLTWSGAHQNPEPAHTESTALPDGNSRGALRRSWFRSWF